MRYNAPVTSVEIVIIGNEILLGVVQDTNSGYLCRTMRAMNGRVRHIAVVPDDVSEISRALGLAIDRNTDLIFTCGGLGPTDDDTTLAAVASAVRKKLVQNGQARQFVADRYAALAAQGFVDAAEMTESRLKMSALPEGATMVDNPVGTAPGAIVEAGRSRIISLPGVPAELKAIVEGPLKPVLSEILGPAFYLEKEILVECGDESILAPVLREVAARHPETYIKSRAAGFGSDVIFRILISATRSASDETSAAINEATADLGRALAAANIKIAN